MRLATLVFLALLPACGAVPRQRGLASPSAAPARMLVVRLLPGEDPKRALEQLVKERGIDAAFVVGAAGSLKRAAVRFADRSETTTLEGKLEVVSLSGAISRSGGSHLHIALAAADGATTGGHLKEGSAVYTTLEVALAVLEGQRFVRELDPRTGYAELFIETGDLDAASVAATSSGAR